MQSHVTEASTYVAKLSLQADSVFWAQRFVLALRAPPTRKWPMPMYKWAQPECSKKESVAHLNESDFTVTAHFYCKHSLIARPQIAWKGLKNYAKDDVKSRIPDLKSDFNLKQYW